MTSSLQTVYRGQENSGHYRRMFNLGGNKDDTDTAAEQVALGRAASQDKAQKPSEDVCVPHATPHNVHSPIWKEEGDASSSELMFSSHSPHADQVMPRLLSRSFVREGSQPAGDMGTI